MRDNENNRPAIGLDIGTSRIVLAERSGEQYRFDAQLNAFVTIPYSKITESVLKKEGVPHSVRGPEIIVHGNESERFADLLHMETRRPMTRGILNPSEPDSVAQLRDIVASMTRGNEGAKVCFSVPAPALGAEENLTYHEATLREILTQQGFEVTSVNEGLAVIYSELESSNYTGIGISFGGGLCNVCVAYLSVPALSFSVGKAGDYIDASAAGATGELATRVRITKEASFNFNGHYTDKLQQVISVYYDEVIRGVVAGLKEAFAGTRTMPRIGRPIPLVVSGGSAMPQGFRDRFEKILRDSDFPVPLSEIRLAEQPLYATAKGALISALAEM